jgi:hypothetical protein
MSVYSECGHPAYGNQCPKCVKEAGAAEERAKIVAWLHEAGYRQIANAIEAKEYLK